jgi:hypothetical protein
VPRADASRRALDRRAGLSTSMRAARSGLLALRVRRADNGEERSGALIDLVKTRVNFVDEKVFDYLFYLNQYPSLR